MSENFLVTGDLLNNWHNGDTQALNELVAHVYSDLHRIAKALMRKERCDHTLTPSALVNELYLQLLQRKFNKPNDKIHFLSLLALELRQILTAHARKKNAAKRKHSSSKINIEDLASNALADQNNTLDLLTMEKILKQLHEMDSQACHIVELKIFAGFSMDEIGQSLNLSERTVYRRWSWAQNWLYKQLKEQPETAKSTVL